MRSTFSRSNPASRASATARVDVRGIVRAAERREHVRHHRLHAEAQPVHAGAAVGRELGRVDAVGVALDRHLGAGAPLDRVEDAHELVGADQRRRSAAEEHARRRRVTRAAPALDVGNARVHVGIDEMALVGPRREVAVVTARRAERDVNVDPEVLVTRGSSGRGRAMARRQVRGACAIGWLAERTTPPACSTVTANARTGPLARNATAFGSGPSTPAETVIGAFAGPVTAQSW